MERLSVFVAPISSCPTVPIEETIRASRDHLQMANYMDHLLVVDEFTRASTGGCVMGGYEMHTIAREAGLVEPGNEIAANWTGILVELGYLTHGPPPAGDQRPIPPGRMWTGIELQRVNDYRVTGRGREEADRMRRLAREQRTDAALGLGFPNLTQRWMDDGQRGAILAPLAGLQAGLDTGSNGAAIGAAKDLVEAACKIQIERAGGSFGRGDSLPTLFKAVREADGTQAPGEEVTKSLAATVQRLAELRNAVGAGHGQASVLQVGGREALLAATAAIGVAGFVLAER